MVVFKGSGTRFPIYKHCIKEYDSVSCLVYTDGEISIRKNVELDGTTLFVNLSTDDLEQLNDGVIRYTANFVVDDEIISFEDDTTIYLKTPADYKPQTYVNSVNGMTGDVIVGTEYILPTATATRLGGVKIGEGINVAADGTISVNGGSSDIVTYCINDLTQEQLAAIWVEYHTNQNIPANFSITYTRQNGSTIYNITAIQAVITNAYVSFFHKLNENEDSISTNASVRLFEDGRLEEFKGGDTYKKSKIDSLLKAKQDTLVPGTNIKTLNGNSILGAGNIEIQGGDSKLLNIRLKADGTCDFNDDLFRYYINHYADDNMDLKPILIKTVDNHVLNCTYYEPGSDYIDIGCFLYGIEYMFEVDINHRFTKEEIPWH